MFIKTAISLNLHLIKNQERGLQKILPLLTNVNVHRRLYSTEKKSQKDAQTDRRPVYFGVLSAQIKAVKLFSLTTSAFGVAAQPYLYNEIVSTGNIPLIVAAYTGIGFFTIATPVLLHLIARKYVTQLDYKASTDSYVAKTVNFFCITKEIEFKTSDVEVPDVPGMFTTLFAKGKPLFFDPRFFDDVQHYSKLMGYDKPMDFKLYDNTSNGAPPKT